MRTPPTFAYLCLPSPTFAYLPLLNTPPMPMKLIPREEHDEGLRDRLTGSAGQLYLSPSCGRTPLDASLAFQAGNGLPHDAGAGGQLGVLLGGQGAQERGDNPLAAHHMR